MDGFLNFMASTVGSAAVIGALLWISRAWFLERLKGSIKSEYDRDLETLRSELRSRENELAGKMRSNETQLAALREGALSGNANRQAVLYTRRLQAVDRVWAEVGKLSAYKMVASIIAITKIENAAKEAEKNPRMRQVFETINKTAPEKVVQSARDERPHLTSIAWAYFQAYQIIMLSSYAVSKAFEHGAGDYREMLDSARIRGLVKATLPHQADFIDKAEVTTFAYLLDELEDKLLCELKKILDGAGADQASIAQAANIMKEVEKVSQSQGAGAST